MISTENAVHPFQFEGSGLRGRLVRLGAAADTILTQQVYPEPVAHLLGETIVMAVMLAAALKYAGVFTLQAEGSGPVRLLIADVTTGPDPAAPDVRAVRGYARFDSWAAEGPPDPQVPLRRLLGPDGLMAITVDQGAFTDRYQGVVELAGNTLAECFQHYFRQSEQIETGLVTAVGRSAEGRWRCGGLMLQRMPGPQRIPDNGDFGAPDGDDWRRAMVLAGSCASTELLDATLPAHDLLFRLFHSEAVRVYPAYGVAARCRCSTERVGAVIRQVPRSELDQVVRAEGAVTVTCEFCNQAYRFGTQELDVLFGDP